MILSEADAKTKWCPFHPANRIYDHPYTYTDTREDAPMVGTCIASDCMAWRFAGRGNGTGYCGLAGIPISLGRR